MGYRQNIIGSLSISINSNLEIKQILEAFSYINAKFGVKIEDFVQIGSHCSIYSVSTIDKKHGKVLLKKGCRIGTLGYYARCDRRRGINYWAFSFVNSDIPDGVLAYGKPAKVIRSLTENEIDKER